MNYLDKQKEYIRLKELFNKPYSEGCVKITSRESELHAKVKCQVVHYLKVQGFECWTEVNLKQSARCDILAIKNNIAYAFEIISSESKKSISNKLEKYPIPLIQVDANKFNYDTFCI